MSWILSRNGKRIDTEPSVRGDSYLPVSLYEVETSTIYSIHFKLSNYILAGHC